MKKIFSALALVSLFCLSAIPLRSHAQTAAIQAQIDNACSTGGTVTLPPSVTLTSTLFLHCAPGGFPITLQGAPSNVTCQTGATSCIVVGGGVGVPSRLNLGLRDIYMTGPGRAVAGSEGIRVTIGYATISDIRIDSFDVGMKFIASNLLMGDRITNAVIGVPSASVNIAIHLYGESSNIKFVNPSISGWNRLILSDGPGGTGSGASFMGGTFNTTRVPGVASVYIASSDGSQRQLSLSNIEDWETACPYLEIGDQGNVSITGVAWMGDPRSSGNIPAIRMLPNSISWLRISNANLNACSGQHGDIVKVETDKAFLAIGTSDIYHGTINFVQPSIGVITGNRCTWWPNSGQQIIGNLAKVRSTGNFGYCQEL